jgi:hypothetical protein
MSSLPPSDALYHAVAKLFKRSEGRSAVAAAAYRSASCLTDDRIGQVFDYTKKSKVAAFIVAPANAPAWTQDRGDLWNRAEAAEKRKDAKVAREWEISIPRDIPRDQWEAFAREIVAPYVATGAVADVAIHCPRAADGEPQPHIHAMLTLRGLDASTESGFAATRNAALESMHAVGSRKAGMRGDAIKVERERIAIVMNEYLERAGSARRVSHLSNADRGLDRDPEPTMGESRKAAAANRGKHDSVTSLVARMRKANALENELAIVEDQIMALNPKFQTPAASGGIKPRRQQDYKAKLLSSRFPDAKGIDQNQLYMIDVKQMGVTRIQTRDHGWVEIDHAGRTIKTYGQPGYADAIAKSLYDADYADHVERLEELKAAGRRGGIQPRRKGEPAPMQDMAQVESRADRWRSRGFTNVVEATDGTWVHIGSCKLQDLGNQVRVHGKVNDDAIRAMLLKAADEWGGEIEVFGTKEFKDAAWLEAQRMGITVFDKDTDELYEPSPDVKAAFEADRKMVAEASADMETVKDQRDIAELLKEAVSGDVAAIAKLENSGESGLTDFATLHLDDKQRQAFAVLSAAEIAEGLPAFRRAGVAAREADDARRGEASQAIKLETLTKNDDENDPVPEQKPSAKPNGKLNLKKSPVADDEMDLDAELARQEAVEKADNDPNYGF